MGIPMGRLEALAVISGEGSLRGTVKFYIASGGVLVVAEIRGLPKTDTGFFALHIHEGRSCAGEGYADTLGHYNPGDVMHPGHAGDLPPLLSNGGRAFLAVETGRFSLADVIGRTVVIHRGADDFKTQPAGNVGEKIGCGIIRWVRTV